MTVGTYFHDRQVPIYFPLHVQLSYVVVHNPLLEALNTWLIRECLFWIPLEKLTPVNCFLRPFFDNSAKLYGWSWYILFNQITICWGSLVILHLLFFLLWWKPILKQLGDLDSVVVWNSTWHLDLVPQSWWYFSHLLFLEMHSIILIWHQFLFLLSFWIGWLNFSVVSAALQVKLNILHF